MAQTHNILGNTVVLELNTPDSDDFREGGKRFAFELDFRDRCHYPELKVFLEETHSDTEKFGTGFVMCRLRGVRDCHGSFRGRVYTYPLYRFLTETNTPDQVHEIAVSIVSIIEEVANKTPLDHLQYLTINDTKVWCVDDGDYIVLMLPSEF